MQAFVARACSEWRGSQAVDPQLRALAAEIAPLCATKPELALQRLQQLVPDVARGFPLRSTTERLARTITLETFYLHHVTEEARAQFTAYSHFASVIRKTSPGARGTLLRSFLGDEPLIPAEHSWLVRSSFIDGMNGATALRRLEMPALPPVVVLHLDGSRLPGVRAPRLEDAVAGGHYYWSPTGHLAAAELLDGAIPMAALLEVEYRP